MFLLNKDELDKIADKGRFNTSHVLIKPAWAAIKQPYGGVSIHLMFLLNSNFKRLEVDIWQVSIHLMFLLNEIISRWVRNRDSFNTSHVLIKREGFGNVRNQGKFQYISCSY